MNKMKEIKCYCGHTTTCDCGPLEEPKQETLEEAAEIFVNNRFTKQICGDEHYPDIYASKSSIIESHILFAAWQQQNSYSEEEVKQFAFECVANFLSNDDNKVEIKLVDVIIDRLNNKFEQFKKK